MKTTTQRQIEREAEKDLDAAQAALDAAEDELERARWAGLREHSDALISFQRAIDAHAAAIKNLERTTHDDPDT